MQSKEVDWSGLAFALQVPFALPPIIFRPPSIIDHLLVPDSNAPFFTVPENSYLFANCFRLPKVEHSATVAAALVTSEALASQSFALPDTLRGRTPRSRPLLCGSLTIRAYYIYGR